LISEVLKEMLIPYKNIVRVVIIVGIILLIPLIMTIHDGAVEGVGWNWTPIDFITMGGILFIAGLAIDIAIRKLTRVNRIIAVAIIVFAFLILWVELATDGVSHALGLLLS
jgi:hypothetical protein